jgi:SET domain-containing protein
MVRSLPHEGVFVRLGVSEIHGVGVFAQQRIDAGLNLFANDSRAITWVPSTVLEDEALPEFARRLYLDFAIRRGDELGCPANFNLLTIGWYLNEPTAGQQPNVTATANFDLVALRDIEAGEELTLSYASFSQSTEQPVGDHAP